MTPVAGSSTTDSGWARPLVSHRSLGAATAAAVLKAIRVAVSATTTGRMVLLARWFGLGLGSGGPARIRTLNPLLRSRFEDRGRAGLVGVTEKSIRLQWSGT